jgi:hypothetical protein
MCSDFGQGVAPLPQVTEFATFRARIFIRNGQDFRIETISR